MLSKVTNFKLVILIISINIFCKIVGIKKGFFGFRKIHDSVSQQKTIWSRLFGLWYPKSFDFDFKRKLYRSFFSISSHLHNTIVFRNSCLTLHRQEQKLPKVYCCLGDCQCHHYDCFLHLQTDSLTL